MKEGHRISRDAEATLYLSVFLAKRKDAHKDKALQFQKVPQSGQSRRPCIRCGAFCHAPNTCTSPLPSIAELEDALDSNLRRGEQLWQAGTIKKREKELPNKTSKPPLSTADSWKTTTFCLNCGKSGHTGKNCSDIPFPELITSLPGWCKSAVLPSDGPPHLGSIEDKQVPT
jgi:hypothetical protein